MLDVLTRNFTDERAVAENTCRAARKDIFHQTEAKTELELVGLNETPWD
jgi:hypothetical protein